MLNNILISGKHIIAGEYSASSTEVFATLNPVTGKNLSGNFHIATVNEVNKAATAAKEAFVFFSNKGKEEKALFLEAIATEIEALGDILIEWAMAETGLPKGRLEGECKRTTGQLRLFAEVVREGNWRQARIDTALPERHPLPRPLLTQLQIAVGPVAVFGASNFPLAFSVAGGDTASAFAAGCPVIVKAHNAHAGTCELVALAITKAIKKTGMPAGVFSLLHGNKRIVGEQLVKHPFIKAVGFTGSFAGGIALCEIASNRDEPIPVFAEMSSINPVVVLEKAATENAASIAVGFVASLTLGVGQFCTNPGLLFVFESNARQIIEKITNEFRKAKGGVMLHSGIYSSYMQANDAIQKEGSLKLLAEGQPVDGHLSVKPFLYCCDEEIFLSHYKYGNEIFGPTGIIVIVKDGKTLKNIFEILTGQLTITIHGNEDEIINYTWLIELAKNKAGRVLLNGFPTGVEVCHAMVHGGPYPATTDASRTSVGTAAIYRFTRPVCFQNFPDSLLPDELKAANPLNVWRLVNGSWTKNSY